MTKKVDNYNAFNEVNLSNARSENESQEDYKNRLKQNRQMLKLYDTVGRDIFKEMFPLGVAEALKNIAKQANDPIEAIENKVKANTEELGEAK